MEEEKTIQIKKATFKNYNELLTISKLIIKPNLLHKFFLLRDIFLNRVYYIGNDIILSWIVICRNCILLLVTDPKFKGKGYATELLKFAEDKIKAKGFKRIILFSPQKSISFYEDYGFKSHSIIPMIKNILR